MSQSRPRPHRWRDQALMEALRQAETSPDGTATRVHRQVHPYGGLPAPSISRSSVKANPPRRPQVKVCAQSATAPQQHRHRQRSQQPHGAPQVTIPVERISVDCTTKWLVDGVCAPKRSLSTTGQPGFDAATTSNARRPSGRSRADAAQRQHWRIRHVSLGRVGVRVQCRRDGTAPAQVR